MSLELVKEAVRLNQSIGEDTTQHVVENDIIVPDVKPDIVRILMLDGEAWINGAEAATDRLLVNGTIRYKILYVSDDPDQPVRSITTSSAFQYSMDIPNTRQGMSCRAKCDIEHMEYEILNSRKVNVKTIISLYGRVTDQSDQYVTQDFTGVDGIQVLRNTISVNSYIGDCSSECPIREILDIPAGKPAILEILRSDVKITSKEYKPIDDKIVASGELNISTLYVSDDETRSIQFVEHEIPFNHLIELPGVNEDSYCDIELELRDVLTEAAEDADGELRQLKCDVNLNFFAECYGTKNIELVEDAYSPYSRVAIEKDQLTVEEVVSENKSQVTLKEIVELDETAPPISELFNVLGKISLSGSEISDGYVTVEGVVVSNMLYLADNSEQPVYCAGREIPFRQTVNMEGARAGMGLGVEMDMEHLSYSIISPKEVELRFVIGINTRLNRQVSVPIISKAAEQPLDEKRLEEEPSVTIYFTQPGDTLWNIAKRHYTTVEEIVMNNDLDDAREITPGEQIIILKKQ
ncbi:MAG: DUF3794 and LysM peptidoglycan-binding domain-containing protein [Bacillota bacterium]